jgi:hypothetical protein
LFLIRNFERDVHDPFLGFIESQQPRQQDRTHIGNGRPHRHTVRSENIQEFNGVCARLKILRLQLRYPLHYFSAQLTRFRNARQIPFDVRKEYRNTRFAQLFRYHFQSHRFPRTGRSGDQAVAIQLIQMDDCRFVPFPDHQFLAHPKPLLSLTFHSYCTIF